MKLGIITPPEVKSLDYAASLGLDFIELSCNCPFGLGVETPGSPLSDGFALLKLADLFKEGISRTGIGVGATGRWASQVFDDDGNFSDKEFEQVKALIDFNAAVGAKVFSVSVNYAKNISYYKNITAAIEYLNRVVEYATPRGVTIALVNCIMGDNFIRTPEQWNLVLPEVPGLGIKYDPSHSFVHAGPEGAYIEEGLGWAQHFAYVHIKGVVQGERYSEPRMWRMLPLIRNEDLRPGIRQELHEMGRFYDNPPAGIDVINWPAFMAILYKHGYDGMLSIEPHSSTWSGELGEKGVRFTVDFMRRLML